MDLSSTHLQQASPFQNGATSRSVLLWGESFSPWSQKAMWALEVSKVRFRFREYTPILSELRLRAALGQWRASVSVPVLLTHRGVVRDSWHIARWAYAQQSHSGSLWSADIAYWNRLSEAALAEARTDALRSISVSRLALEELAPPFLPSSLRIRLAPISRTIVRHLDRKYIELHRCGSIRNALRSLRNALDRHGEFVLGEFSYADITMAVVIEAIDPIGVTSMGPNARECWRNHALISEFPDLVEWRTRLACSSYGFSQIRASPRTQRSIG